MASNIQHFDSNIKVLCLLVGIPASGKSTFVRSFRDYLSSVGSKLHILHLEFDTYLPRDTRCSAREESTDQEFNLRKHRDDLKLKIDTFLSTQLVTGETPQETQLEFPPCPKDSISILTLDDTFHHRSMRYDYYRLARQYKLGFLQLFFEVSLEVSLSRNRVRENRVPEGTVVAIREQMVSPVGSQIKWERHTVPLDTSKGIQFSLVATRIVEVLKFPAPSLECLDVKSGEKAQSRKDTEASVPHQCDIILRRQIGGLVRHASESGMETKEVRLFADKLNAKRREVLRVVSEETWREGHMPLDMESLLSDMLKEAML